LPKVYLDHSATTPVRPEVARLVMEYMTEKFGNPSTLYFYGREAKKAVEKAREQVAALIKADSEEIIFTSGGTEGDNLAILGIARAYAENGQHIITSAVEHHAVLEACRSLEQQGFRLTVLPVDEDGRVSVAELEKALSPDTILISIMHVNNEVGTIQPVEEIGKLARQRGVILHIDGVQSVGKVPVDIGALQADLLTGSGHKIYGPKGTGFLYLRKGIKLAPLVWGGGQEKAYRPGTENVAGIVGLGLAAELADQELHTEMPRLATLRNMLIKGLQENIPDTKLNGPQVGRVPTNVNLRFAGVEGEALLQALDLKGICASSGSACSAGAVNPSHVLLAMGLSRAEAKSSLRMTLGRDNTEEQVAYVLEQLPPLIERLRRK
jgi:cysteine desulfurase